jgi:hypothetical protein
MPQGMEAPASQFVSRGLLSFYSPSRSIGNENDHFSDPGDDVHATDLWATGASGVAAGTASSTGDRSCANDHPIESLGNDRVLVMSAMYQGRKVVERAGPLARSRRSMGCQTLVMWLMNAALG